MRILIHRLGSLGDTLVALPCFRLIRETFPQASITLLTNPPVSHKAAPMVSVLGEDRFFDRALFYPMASRDYPQLARLHADLRRQKFDAYLSLTFGRHISSSIRDYVFFKTCGISRITGLPFAKRDRVCVPINCGPCYEPEAQRLLRRTSQLCPEARNVDPNDARWNRLDLTDQEILEGHRLLEASGIDDSFLVASLGTKWQGKNWGAPNWCRLFQMLSELHPELPLVMLGSNDEFEACQDVLASWMGPKANLCGKTEPRISAAVMRRAQLFLGHDSGPMHLAAASGVKCVAIFSAYNPPGQWFPLGHGHVVFYPKGQYREELWDNLRYQQNLMSLIKPEEVFAAARALLAGSTPPSSEFRY